MNSWDKPKDRKDWYTLGELAELTNLSKRTLERWVERGKIPGPLERTPSDWKLWSPEQATAILAVVSRKPGVRGKSSP